MRIILYALYRLWLWFAANMIVNIGLAYVFIVDFIAEKVLRLGDE